MIKQIVDPESYVFDIIHKEMANPTGLLVKTIEEATKPLEIQFNALLKELLGKNATQQQVMLCHMSIRAQCFGPLLHFRHQKKESSSPGPKLLPPDITIENLTSHIIRFSLAGIKTYIEKE